ncbi:MAG: hypothetical protein LC733_04225 [Actinobacteria bacterium]|nr:hypothetical protein [Actinomycetota bacterium]
MRRSGVVRLAFGGLVAVAGLLILLESPAAAETDADARSVAREGEREARSAEREAEREARNVARQAEITERKVERAAEVAQREVEVTDRNAVRQAEIALREPPAASSSEMMCDCLPAGGPASPFTFTTDADFDRGELVNVVHTPSDQLQLAEETSAFEFLWVAVTTRDNLLNPADPFNRKGTIVKIDTRTQQIVGEYWTSPDGEDAEPSRTTVDPWGNVWAANRRGNSVVRIGMVENHQCQERNGNPGIQTSTGQGDIRPWLNTGNQDTNGGVSTAEDECLIVYTRTTAHGTRHISVSLSQDVWVSGTGFPNDETFNLISPDGTILHTEPSVHYGGYGGLTDEQGVVWSAGPPRDTRFDTLGLLRWDPVPAQGCVVGLDDHVWVAHSTAGTDDTVGRLRNDGFFLGEVTVGFGPTGAAVDRDGYIWVTNYGADNVVRIDPNAGPVGLDGITPRGMVTTPPIDVRGSPYNYSDMTGSAVPVHPKTGSWEVVYDCGPLTGAQWGAITGNSTIPPGTDLVLTASSSADGINFSTPVRVTPGSVPAVPTGRYLKVRVVFLRDPVGGASPILHDLTIRGIDPARTDCCDDHAVMPPAPPTPTPPVLRPGVVKPLPPEVTVPALPRLDVVTPVLVRAAVPVPTVGAALARTGPGAATLEVSPADDPAAVFSERRRLRHEARRGELPSRSPTAPVPSSSTVTSSRSASRAPSSSPRSSSSRRCSGSATTPRARARSAGRRSSKAYSMDSKRPPLDRITRIMLDQGLVLVWTRRRTSSTVGEGVGVEGMTTNLAGCGTPWPWRLMLARRARSHGVCHCRQTRNVRCRDRVAVLHGPERFVGPLR